MELVIPDIRVSKEGVDKQSINPKEKVTQLPFLRAVNDTATMRGGPLCLLEQMTAQVHSDCELDKVGT